MSPIQTRSAISIFSLQSQSLLLSQSTAEENISAAENFLSEKILKIRLYRGWCLNGNACHSAWVIFLGTAAAGARYRLFTSSDISEPATSVRLCYWSSLVNHLQNVSCEHGSIHTPSLLYFIITPEVPHSRFEVLVVLPIY